MQKLEGLQHAEELDINIGYYTIRISPASQYMTKIVNEFGKFRYNHLPMVMCASGDILQVKVYKILSDTKGVKTYINDILVLSKDLFKNHIGQMRIIFGRFRAAVLKANAHKCSFGLT